MDLPGSSTNIQATVVEEVSSRNSPNAQWAVDVPVPSEKTIFTHWPVQPSSPVWVTNKENRSPVMILLKQSPKSRLLFILVRSLGRIPLNSGVSQEFLTSASINLNFTEHWPVSHWARLSESVFTWISITWRIEAPAVGCFTIHLFFNCATFS